MMDLSLKPFTVKDKVPCVPCVYSFLNTATGDCYIGSTNCFKERKRQHVQMVLRGKHESRLVQESWDKWKNCFIFVLIQVEPDKEKRLDLEQFYIDTLQSSLNICRTSRSVKGRVYTEASLERMSKAQIGRKASEETLAKLRFAQQNRTQEAKDKTAAAHRGMKRSEEARKNISLSKAGVPQSKEAVTKRAHSNKKPIDQFTLDGVYMKTWLSAVDVALSFNCTDAAISQCARGITKKSQGFIWRFSSVEKSKILS